MGEAGAAGLSMSGRAIGHPTMRHAPRRRGCFCRFPSPLTAVGLLLPGPANQSSGPVMAWELMAAELVDPPS
jgi:hypothetical protein